MRSKNQSTKAINNLTIKFLKNKKVRNCFTIISIILTCILFTALFTVFTSVKESFQEQSFRSIGARDHAVFKFLTEDQVKKLSSHKSIKSSVYSYNVSFASNKELQKNRTELNYYNQDYWDKNGQPLIEGRLPLNKNEIVTSLKVLELLGVSPKVGEKVIIEYELLGEVLKSEFILSGYYKHDSAFTMAQYIIVSEDFINQMTEKQNQYSLYVSFGNSLNINEKAKNIIVESGYSVLSSDKEFIDYNTNPAYLNSSLTIETIILLVFFILIIMSAGYFIIYNLFMISVTIDIKFYGLLKNIGATSKQIKNVVIKQIFYLALYGIPIGLFVGYFIGINLVPFITKMFTFGDVVISSFNSSIFILSTFFVMITIYLSVYYPGKLASSISPVEVLKYSGANIDNKRSRRKNYKNLSLWTLAWLNLFRNKKRGAILIISLSLSPIILSSIINITNSFDYNKFLKKFSPTDFVIGNKNYFNYKFYNDSDRIEEDIIKFVDDLDGVLNSGEIYYTPKYSEDFKENINKKDILTTLNEGIEYMVQLYGMDSFPISKYEIIDGDLDMMKLDTGNYIIEAIDVDDFMNTIDSKYQKKVGDKVKIKLGNGVEKEFELIAKVKSQNFLEVRRGLLERDVLMILPSKEYKNIIKDPLLMSYVFDVEEKYLEEINTNLNEYTTTVNDNLDFDSIIEQKKEFKSLNNLFAIPGYVLATVIGLIGIINFINVIYTGIITRYKEFAIFESIGMTNKQLKKMLIYEGVVATLISTSFFCIFGSLINITVIKVLINSLWFTNYKFDVSIYIPITIIYLVISIIVPLIVFKNSKNNSIVQRLSYF